MLTISEQRRNEAILKALREQAERHRKNPEEARAFLMKLGLWNEDGTLKDKTMPPDAEHPVNYRKAFAR